MANTIAYVVFWSWPLVVFWLLIKYPIKHAIFTATILSTLLLPAGFLTDPPILPPLDRQALTSLSLLVFLSLMGKRFRVSNSGVILKLLICYLVIVLLTSALNSTPIMTLGKLLPGYTFKDALYNIMEILIWIIPFFLGRHFFNNVKDNEAIFKILVVLALIYSLPKIGRAHV